MDTNNMTLEEKVDKILKYQTRIYRWQVAKFIIGLVLFIVLVVIPIIWFIYWIKSMDFSGIGETYENLKDTSGGLDKINEMLKNIQY